MKILILRFSSIGDIVLCTPIIRACKLQLDASIHFLTKEKYRTILAHNPYIDKLYTFQKEPKEILSQLKNESYDLVIDLHKNIRSFKVSRSLKTKVQRFPKLNVQKWARVNLRLDMLPNLHIVDRYFMAIEELEVVNDNQGLDFFIGEENRISPDTIHPDLSKAQKPIVSLVIGATYFTKKIPESLASDIIASVNANVILIGGPGEKTIGNRLAGKFDNCFTACGQFSIPQSASIMDQSELVISGDTGMMHIAAALKKQIVMIWGSTISRFGMGPYQTEAFHHEVIDVKCRPCSKLGYQKCPKKHFACMNNHDTVKILKDINSVLKI